MIKIIKKLNIFKKGPAPYVPPWRDRSGFVILFAITLSAILLSIALGVANVSFKEIKFGTSAKDTNEAFFAADTGAECAFVNDKSTGNSFVSSGGTGNIQCLGTTISLSGSSPVWSFVLSGLGPQGKGCAKVTVDKTSSPTQITSNGYNNGSGSGTCIPGANTIERELLSTYEASPTPLVCVPTAGSPTPTPTIDEDCDGNMDNTSSYSCNAVCTKEGRALNIKTYRINTECSGELLGNTDCCGCAVEGWPLGCLHGMVQAQWDSLLTLIDTKPCCESYSYSTCYTYY